MELIIKDLNEILIFFQIKHEIKNDKLIKDLIEY